MGENFKAFAQILDSCTSCTLRIQEELAQDYLGNALTHDPKNAKTILAAGSIIQELISSLLQRDLDIFFASLLFAMLRQLSSARPFWRTILTWMWH